MYGWIQRNSSSVPDEPEPQNELLQTETQLVSLLRSIGEDREANELSQAADNLRKKLEERNALVSPVVEHNQHPDDQAPNSKNRTPDSAENRRKEPVTKSESK